MAPHQPSSLTISEDLGALMLPSGEKIPFPTPFDQGELVLAGNCRYIGDAAIVAYDPETGTGMAWRRNPKPHWQLIQPVTRDGFEDWARQYIEAMLTAGDFPYQRPYR